MDLEGSLSLNRRVSLFRENQNVYLFDPFTRTYISMNEHMLSIITKPDSSKIIDELTPEDRNRIADITTQLRELGILTTTEDENYTVGQSFRDVSDSNTYLTLFVTNKCNLRCTYCYAEGGDLDETITRDIWHLAMDYYFTKLDSGNKRTPAPKFVNLAIHGGGEPTVEFDLLREIVDEFKIRAQGLGLETSVSIGTNGTYGELVQSWIFENNISVNISLDGPRDIHDRQRPLRSGKGSYDIVERNILALIREGRQVSVRVTVTNESTEFMEKTIELAAKLGIASVHFEPVSLTGRCSTNNISRPDAGRFCDLFLKCFKQGLEHDINVRYSGMRCFDDPSQEFCAACGHNFCVTPRGDITTCYEVLRQADPASSEFFIGKVDTIQRQVILNQSRIEQLKQRVTDNMEACKNCFLRYHCAGDCPVKSFRYSNRNLYSPDPYRCRIAERINKQLIQWLSNGEIEPRDPGKTRVFSFNRK